MEKQDIENFDENTKVFLNSVEAFNEDQYNSSEDDKFEELYNKNFKSKKKEKYETNNWERSLNSGKLTDEELDDIIMH